MNDKNKNTSRPTDNRQGPTPERPRRPLTEEEKRDIARRRAAQAQGAGRPDGQKRQAPPRRPLTEEEKRELARRRAEQARRNGAPEGRKAPQKSREESKKNALDKVKDFFRSTFSSKKKDEAPPPRRRNDESYNFSRSLSETQERIMAERRERLEDAKAFRQEDIRQKVKYGVIIFTAILLVAATITTVSVSCALSGARVKRGEGEYVFTVGKYSGNAAYKDTAKNGVIYINMNEIANLCGMTVGGSADDLRFTVPSGDWVSFKPGSDTATINGYGIKMSAPAKLSDTVCHVPLDFIEMVMDGIEVSVDENEKKVTVTRVEYNDSTPLEPHYVDVYFMLKADIPMNSLDENKYFSGLPLFSFKNDLTAYEQYMNPEGDRANDFLMLINRENPVSDTSYDPADTHYTPESNGVYKEFWLEPNAAKALDAMMIEMKSAGFTNVFVTSGYRSYGYQSRLYEGYVAEEMAKDPSLTRAEAEAIVDTYSARPGYSEHQTGLAVDFMTTDMSELTNSFANQEIYDWLCANAWKFGFVLRYPEDKVDVTGYAYESWHWRFVGRSHALEMLKSGECLDEYIARISSTDN